MIVMMIIFFWEMVDLREYLKSYYQPATVLKIVASLAEVKFWPRRIKLSSSDSLYTMVPEPVEFCTRKSKLMDLSMKITNAILVQSIIRSMSRFHYSLVFICFFLWPPQTSGPLFPRQIYLEGEYLLHLPFLGVWSHGDFCEISSKTGGITMLGRR